MEVGEAALEDILFRNSSGFVFFVPNSLMFLLVAHHQKGNPGGRNGFRSRRNWKKEKQLKKKKFGGKSVPAFVLAFTLALSANLVLNSPVVV